ncbi:MAG: PQQ-binding-like beta-propeller repeat protein [Fimbriiglobus sp.]
MTRLLSLCALISVVGVAHGDDWPQWMGPNRDGTWNENATLDKFPEGGPKKLWSKPVGGGYSGPSVANGKVYVTDYVTQGDLKNNPAARANSNGEERLLCFDAKTGNLDWKLSQKVKYSVSYPAGPRANPTVADGKIYTVGSMGNFRCVSTKGELLWEKDFPKDYKTETPIWGFCSHPLIYKNLVICIVGGEGSVAVAFDKNTGAEVWKALSASEPGYSAPAVIHAGGVDQLLIWHAKSVNSLDPLNGKKYWSSPLEPNYGMSIMMPRLSGDLLFAGGIGGKSLTLRLHSDQPEVTEVSRGKRTNSLYPVNSTPIIDSDTIYGVDQPGQLRAVNLRTGDRHWYTFKPVLGKDEQEDYRGAGSGTAFLTKNGDKYYLFGETGRLTIAKLSPEKYDELDSAQIIEATGEAFGRKVVWSCPAFSNQCIFVRNDKELACFSLAK